MIEHGSQKIWGQFTEYPCLGRTLGAFGCTSYATLLIECRPVEAPLMGVFREGMHPHLVHDLKIMQVQSTSKVDGPLLDQRSLHCGRRCSLLDGILLKRRGPLLG